MLEIGKPKLFLSFILVLSLTFLISDIYSPKINTEQAATAIEETVAPVVKQVNQEQLKCLAANIYHEARGEPFMGQVAVARVVMNRVQHGFASTPCKVVYQATFVQNPDDPDDKTKICQFSWVCQGKTMPERMSARYKQAEEIATQVLAENKWADIIPNNVLFFHNLSVAPNWAYKKVTTIGNHIFYSRGKEKKLPEQQ
jgi:spore germination cell wall hydrolase CwlJ-like protein